MISLQWLITELIALLKLYWKRRAKSYTRISLALIAGGIAILSASPLVLALQLLKIVAAPNEPDSPWWTDPAIGLSLVVAGVIVFVLFYWIDPDRRKATPPPPSFTITPGTGWTFELAAITIGQLARKPVQLVNFSASERSAPIRSHQISADTAEELLENLGALAVGRAIPEYNVLPQASIIIVRRK